MGAGIVGAPSSAAGAPSHPQLMPPPKVPQGFILRAEGRLPVGSSLPPQGKRYGGCCGGQGSAVEDSIATLSKEGPSCDSPCSWSANGTHALRAAPWHLLFKSLQPLPPKNCSQGGQGEGGAQDAAARAARPAQGGVAWVCSQTSWLCAAAVVAPMTLSVSGTQQCTCRCCLPAHVQGRLCLLVLTLCPLALSLHLTAKICCLVKTVDCCFLPSL
jgi:hypothetical protein